MNIVDIILKKRHNIALTKEEIDFFIKGIVSGVIKDYQASALLMAICFNSMNEDETFYLTKAIVDSGDTIDLSSIEGIKVDKHSTGGVGDKTSLVLGPLAASCGLKVAKLSGRGLGHTGGTLDKLESLDGFNISLSENDFIKQVNEIGVALIGQTATLAPADKILYALRDVTGTVDSIPLIASSIMSKKIASGADYIYLDLKIGEGAFMKTIDSALELAKAMVSIGDKFSKKTTVFLTEMNTPLGKTIGNSLEVYEAIATLQNHGPNDLATLCKEIIAYMLLDTNKVSNLEEGRKLVENKYKSHEAYDIFKKMVQYQGGKEISESVFDFNSNVIKNYDLKFASQIIEIKASKSGYIQSIDAFKIATGALLVGAGRVRKEDDIDHSVGVYLDVIIGDYVVESQTLCRLFTNTENENAIKSLEESFVIAENKVELKPLIYDVIRS